MARQKVCAVIGAGDYIGGGIAKRFARAGYAVFAGRRNADKLAPLADDIKAEGGVCFAHGVDARKEDQVTAFMAAAAAHGDLDVCVFNVGGNVRFPILETTERVFRKVWEQACYAGFLTGREAARHMVPRGAGSIFFTGATASLRGGAGYAAFASAKFGLRALAQSMARELGPHGIHVVHLVLDAMVDTQWVRERITAASGADALDKLKPHELMDPAAVGDLYWQLHAQPRSAWTHELDVRPYIERW